MTTADPAHGGLPATEHPTRQWLMNASPAHTIGSVVQATSIQGVYVSAGNSALNPLPVPRQLPPPAACFVNRDRELDLLSRLVLRDTRSLRPRIAVLSGMSGVGKTAAAVQWANAHAELFAGGQLYADLAHYRTRGGVEVAEVLGAFLRALGLHSDYLPAELPERVALFRSKTAAAPLLVVLDDVDHAAQVRPFLPAAPGSVVLVTSKRRLTSLLVDGAESVEVPPLTSDAGALLLKEFVRADRLGDDQVAVSDLVALCAGLPVALRVAGIRLAERRHLSIDRLVARLTSESSRLGELSRGGEYDVAAVFDLAYAELPAKARTMYCDLGLHPGPDFGIEVAAATSDLASDDAEEALGILCEANLIEELGTDRYRFHDLVRLHARQRAERDQPLSVRDRVLRKVVDWYLLGASAADHAVLGKDRWRLAKPDLSKWRIRFSPASAMAWFETERANLLAATRSAAAHEWYEQVWQFCEVLWAFYHSRKHYPDWVETHRLGATAAQRVENPGAGARMHNQIARAHLELEDYAEAHVELARALDLALESGNRRAEAAVLESAGLLDRDEGRYLDALDRFQRAWTIFDELGDQRGAALQAYQAGDVLVRNARPESAVSVLHVALDLLSTLDDEMTESRVRITLGKAYHALGRNDDARTELDAAIMTARARCQPVKEAQALEAMLMVAEQNRDTALLETSARRLVQVYLESGNPRGVELTRLLEQGRLPGTF
jgi:tetratricopeptide (TPR) repeat protein